MKRENAVLRDEFEEYRIECESALDVNLARINSVKKIAKRSGKRNFFGTIEGRIKTFESVIEKCERKGYALDIESVKRNVLDVAGIRIITPFRDDIFNVVEALRHIPGINISDEKDYVTSPKPNGYSSYHIHAQVEIYSPITGGSKLVPIEIQIRDKAMDLWASVEHVVKYKNDNPSPEVGDRFKEIAEILYKFDDMAIELRDFGNDRSDIGNDQLAND